MSADNVNVSTNLDDAFEAFAKQQEADARARASNTTGSFQKNYEDIEYTGLVSNEPKIVRCVGGPPDSNLGKGTARTCTISMIVGDDGKYFRCIRPSFSENPGYIINKIISEVKKTKWVNTPTGSTKTYPVKISNPDLFNKIDKNGIDPKDIRYNYNRGWSGQEFLIINVIDRSRMDWHKEHKHTMLLSKNVKESNDVTYADAGVPSYGFLSKLTRLMCVYKSWENYDISIVKTGLKENPYDVVNATTHSEEVPEPYKSYISYENKLTDEEASWERYDLNKLFAVTSATKIYNKLRNTIGEIDRALGTRFIDELQRLSEKEREEFNKEDEDDTPVQPEKPVTPSIHAESISVRQPVSSTIAQRTPIISAYKNLPYTDEMTEQQKNAVKKVTRDTDGNYNIEWEVPTNDTIAKCPVCGAVSLMSMNKCPACGKSFI